MTSIDILLQGEGIVDIQLISLPGDAGHEELLVAAGGLHGLGSEDFHIFVQDADEPLKPHQPLPRPKPGVPLCLHTHRCKRIKVAVAFNGKTVETDVTPAKTIGALKTQVAVKLFGMEKADAAEHVLQFAGTVERPDADTHVGVLAKHCAVAFDLVPLVRVEG